MNCPLCRGENHQKFVKDRKRDYYTCHDCHLVFTGTQFYLTSDEEKRLYDFHQNTPDNKGYCDFLMQIVRPILGDLKDGHVGLDFGCGPGPTLNLLFKENGYDMDLYDPFYKNDKSVFDKQYDFVTSTEVFEHLQRPDKVIDQIRPLLKENALLGVMTKIYDDSIDFKNWYYKNDMTHIVFYRRETIEWIANKWSFDYKIYGDNVIVFKGK